MITKVMIPKHSSDSTSNRFLSWAIACYLSFVVCFLFGQGQQGVAHAAHINSPTHRSLIALRPSAQSDKEVRPLEPGKPIQRDLKGGEKHSYQLNLSSSQLLHLVVAQQGIDVMVTLFGPDNKQIVEVDSPNGTRGPEHVWLVSNAAGMYRAEVRSLEEGASPGRYEARIEELRAATAQDPKRVSAQMSLLRGQQLSAESTTEAIHKAERIFKDVLAVWRELGDRADEAVTLNHLGLVYAQLEDDQKALDYYHQALPIFQSLGDRQAEAALLISMGLAYSLLNDNRKALDYYDHSLALSRAIGDRNGESVTLSNIAEIYSRLGERQKALDMYQEAFALSRAIGDRQGEAAILMSIGSVYVATGEPRKGLDYFNQALPIFRALKDRSWEASTLNNMGYAYYSLSEKQKALEFYEQALALRRALGERRGVASLLLNTGILYSSLGNTEKALDYYTQARSIYQSVEERIGEARALNNIGFSYSLMGDTEKALDYYNQALPVIKASDDKLWHAVILNNIGLVYNKLGQRQQALNYYLQALPLLRAVGDRRMEANTLANAGFAYNLMKENQNAQEQFNRSLMLARAVGDRTIEAASLLGIATVERDRGNLQEARARIESAIAIIESLRSGLKNQELRTSYLASAQQYYKFYIDVLMRLHQQHPSEGYDAHALQISERARARSLLDMLNESGANIRQGVDPVLLERERSLKQTLNAKAERQARLLSGKPTEQQLMEVKKEIDDLLVQIEQVEAQIRAKSPRYAALTQPTPLSLKEAQQQVLDSDTILLEYALGDEHSYLWLVTTTTLKSYTLPSRAEIESAAKRVYGLLTARNESRKFETSEERQRRIAEADSSYLEAAATLSRMLLGPVAAQLGKKRLLIVAEGALQYIPFAALPLPDIQAGAGRSDGNGIASAASLKRPVSSIDMFVPLIAHHEVVSVPSASTLSVLRQESAGHKSTAKLLAVFADPVFEREDERVKASIAGKAPLTRNTPYNGTRSVENGNEIDVLRSARETGASEDALQIKRLPFTRREAERIIALVPASQRKVALDFNASRATAISNELSQYRYVHFATHGFLNSAHPELSGVVLSLVDVNGEEQDGFLRAHEIFNLKLPAELVVLSGCRTGLGKEVKGEGLVGLTRGFMYAGASRVLVSLWDISDEASSELMVRLYKEMLSPKKLSPAASLRAAQLAIWKEKRWHAPYYWAAFVLQGEPR